VADPPGPEVPVIRALLADMDAGKLAAGDRLPPVPDLAASYGVRVDVAYEAVSELISLGAVTRVPGRGFYTVTACTGGNPPRFLTPAECALQVRVTVITIYRLMDEGVIKSTRIGRSRRIYADSWESYLRGGRMP
jgi:excisionase family DNA binding protein